MLDGSTRATGSFRRHGCPTAEEGNISRRGTSDGRSERHNEGHSLTRGDGYGQSKSAKSELRIARTGRRDGYTCAASGDAAFLALTAANREGAETHGPGCHP